MAVPVVPARFLVPVPVARDSDRDEVPIDGTLAGWSFRKLQMQKVPMEDGASPEVAGVGKSICKVINRDLTSLPSRMDMNGIYVIKIQ